MTRRAMGDLNKPHGGDCLGSVWLGGMGHVATQLEDSQPGEAGSRGCR